MNTQNLENANFEIKDIQTGEWTEHPRFKNILLKSLYTSQENPHANINVVRVPPGGEIGNHSHGIQIETIYILAGNSLMNYQDSDHEFNAGSIVAMPAGIQHSLRNESDTDVFLLTIFTPPL